MFRPKTRSDSHMAEKPEDLGIPMRPARPAVPTPIQARASNPLPPNTDAPKAPEAASPSPSDRPTQPRTMVVGRGISLSGDIKSCNRLVVEGSLEATLHDCGQMEIADGGQFKGNATIERGEIRGEFDGDLVVSNRLLIRATGHVAGTITYGEIEIERGGRITGTIQTGDQAAKLRNPVLV